MDSSKPPTDFISRVRIREICEKVGDVSCRKIMSFEHHPRFFRDHHPRLYLKKDELGNMENIRITERDTTHIIEDN